MEIQSHIEKGLLTVTINRPTRKNSFTNAMYVAIGDAFESAFHNPAVKVVLIKGQPGCFSAGNDLGDFLNQPPTGLDAPVFRFLRLISNFPKPIVAQVEGVAVGIGTTLLLHCDLVYASAKAKFSLPFAKLGLCPEAASSLILPVVAGYPKAAELLLLGDMFDAHKASECAIVTRVVQSDEIESFVQGQVDRLLGLPLPSLLVTKKLLKKGFGEQVAKTLREEGTQFVSMIPRDQAQEAFKAFGEKRAPDFRQFESN